MDKYRTIVLAFFLLNWQFPAWAKEHVVTQEATTFSELFIKVEHDDVIKFINLDSVNHKLTFSHHKLATIETELEPGESQTIIFSKPGVYDVTCHIHPHMKMTVFVPHVDVVLNQ